MDNECNECPICLEELNINEIQKLECGHIFHKLCINEWGKKKPICPLCRKYFFSDIHIHANSTIEIIAMMVLLEDIIVIGNN